VMFTNFVQCVGATRQCRPSAAQYNEATVRLERLLRKFRPKGLWILGLGQATYSAPVIARLGLPYEITRHPTSYGLSNSKLGESWQALMAKMQSHPCSAGEATHVGASMPSAQAIQPERGTRIFFEERPMADQERWGGRPDRDADREQRKWRAFGFGGKTASPSTWRWWDEGRE